MPTKKRQPRHKALAAAIRDRLEELRRENGLNTYAAFAKFAGVPRPQLNAWRNSGVVPGGFYLRRMAESLGVTADWLLCVEGARKYRLGGGGAEWDDRAAALAFEQVMKSFSAEGGGAFWKHLMQETLQENVERFKREAEQFFRRLVPVPGETADERERFNWALLALSAYAKLNQGQRGGGADKTGEG